MSNVEDNIVSMKFDNAAFESKLGETIASLDKLRASLDFATSTRGLENLGAASRNFSMGEMGNVVEGVSNKFLALATIGITALSNLTTKAIESGAAFVKSFTFQPIMDGFHEFETNMNSIQTILANTSSKGTNLEQVNKALLDLNHYSDQTIYNFSQMARNIGTFTAAGIDLDRSTQAIKGIANLAAVSGSNAEQASTAMYQLSQALASGTVKLIDWNSVVNAGMGGEVFQKALFETGKQMKTIAGVPMAMTFDQWKKAGNTFRGSLEEGWITADVLTKTLAGFTGDLTKAQVMSMGYTSAQADEVVRMGLVAKNAATEVKTFTQLVGTVKEAVGSGWTQTFQILIGTFDESKKLFTGINNSIGKFVSSSADARNEMLQTWKDLGGRETLLQGFEDALHGINSMIQPIMHAFRDIFPKTTAQDLFEMTQRFAEFAKNLQIGSETAEKVKRTFAGFFAIFSIGWEVFKNVLGLIGDIIHAFSGVGSSTLDFAANTGDALSRLNAALVVGGGIAKFFDKLSGYIQKAAEFIKDFKNGVVGLFDGFSASDAVEASTKRIGEHLDVMRTASERVGDAFQRMGDRLEGVRRVLDKVWDYISNWFIELGQKLAAVMQPGDFDAAVDVVNVGLLGGIALMLKKFMTGGIKLDLGQGLVKKITKTFDALTGTLKSMQANVKANALLKIAGAVGILTASVVALSLIDSAALTKALTGLAVGFGELLGALKFLDQISTTGGAVKIGLLATSMIALSTAMLILSAAVKNLSSLGWEEMAKGLLGITVMLGAMVTAVNLISSDTGGMIRAGIAISAIAAGMYILSKAVASFGELSWSELVKGLTGVGIGLGVLVTAVNFMPSGPMIAAGLAMIPLATGLLILSKAVESFATMSWGEMAKGMVGIGAGLVIIAGAMQLMPLNLPITATGLLILSGALNVMALAVLAMGSMDFGKIVKGVGGLAAVLTVLVVAMNAMDASLAGAAALVVVSGALVVLTGVLKVLGDMSLGEIAKGLGALAAVFLVLGGAALVLSGVVPVLLALGASLTLIGGGFALFGAGAMLLAKAFEMVADAGKKGAEALVDILKVFITARVEIVQALVGAFIDFAKEILKAAPLIIKSVKVILGHLLDTVIELAPKIAEAIGAIITAGIGLIRDKFPDLVTTGFDMLTTFLSGIRDNIGEILSVGVDIMTNFVQGLIDNMPILVSGAAQLIISFLGEVTKHAAELVAAGLGLLVGLLDGITNNIDKVTKAAADVIVKFLVEIALSIDRIVEAGATMLIWLIDGIINNIVRVVNAVTEIATKFIEELGANQQKLMDAGTQVLTDTLKGIGDNLKKVADTVGDVVTKFIKSLSDNSQKIINAGTDALVTFLKGIGDNLQRVIDAGGDLIIKFIEGIGEKSVEIANAALDTIIKFNNGLAEAINTHRVELQASGVSLAFAIADGITLGLASKVRDIVDGAVNLVKSALNAAKDFLFSHSPSLKFYWLGQDMAAGMANALNDDKSAANSAVQMAERIVSDFHKTLSKISDPVNGMVDISPVITPVLDLTKVQAASRNLNDLMRVSAIVPEVSMDQARQIATTADLANEGQDTPVYSGPAEIKFEQNNYSPTALSTGDIFRNTKSQIALAKEELNI